MLNVAYFSFPFFISVYCKQACWLDGKVLVPCTVIKYVLPLHAVLPIESMRVCLGTHENFVHHYVKQLRCGDQLQSLCNAL